MQTKDQQIHRPIRNRIVIQQQQQQEMGSLWFGKFAFERSPINCPKDRELVHGEAPLLTETNIPCQGTALQVQLIEDDQPSPDHDLSSLPSTSSVIKAKVGLK